MKSESDLNSDASKNESENEHHKYDGIVINRLSPRANAFFEKLFQYPERVFPGFNIDLDFAVLKNKISSSNPSRIILEFGSGSGEHLLSLGKMKPDSLCIGFELRFKRAVRTIQKAEVLNINNVIVMRNKSENSFKYFGKNELDSDINLVDEVYINFPDPWEKKRWLKHRILRLETMLSIASILKKNGFVSVKTDHREYFESFMSEIEDSSDFPYKVEIISHDLKEDEFSDTFPEAGIKTEFEKLFRSQSKPICYARFSLR